MNFIRLAQKLRSLLRTAAKLPSVELETIEDAKPLIELGNIILHSAEKAFKMPDNQLFEASMDEEQMANQKDPTTGQPLPFKREHAEEEDTESWCEVIREDLEKLITAAKSFINKAKKIKTVHDVRNLLVEFDSTVAHIEGDSVACITLDKKAQEAIRHLEEFAKRIVHERSGTQSKVN